VSASQNATRDRIVSIMGGRPRPMCVRELARATGKTAPTVLNALYALAKQSVVAIAARPVAGKSSWWRLTGKPLAQAAPAAASARARLDHRAVAQALAGWPASTRSRQLVI
jgi:DNA-binding transcriptional ArsR family regulator